MAYREKIEHFFALHREEMLRDLERLLEVKSVKGEARPGMPFGEGPAAALELALTLADNLGLSTRNYDNYVGTADLNDNETRLGILAHVDVVGEGENWTYEPYAGTIRDGRIYGRGASDDKGPTIAAMYAMAAVQSMGLTLQGNARLILGTDEESGCADIRYYFEREKAPPFVFSPDGEFPVLNTEKGGIRTSFKADLTPGEELPRIVSVNGGERPNVVPPKAEALIEGIASDVATEYASRAEQSTGARFTITAEGSGSVRIVAEGRGAHASMPDQGINALTAMLVLLSSLPMAAGEGGEAIRSLNRLFPYGDHHGEALGIRMSDEASGHLTVNLSILDYSLNRLDGFIDCRTPLCATEENTLAVMAGRFAERGIRLERAGFVKPHHTPADSPFVQTLLSAYEQYTGLPGHCESTGGATYVHDIDGGVCFGAIMPGTDTRMHGADEFMIVEELLTAAKIYAQVIVDLCE